MSYFRQFPKVKYDIKRNGVLQNMVDIYRSVRVLPTSIDNPSSYKFYEIKNGERPDIVSQRLYGTSEYYWTFFVVNEFLHDGLAAWPMSQEDLQEYMDKEYEGWVITTRPSITRNTDLIITEFRDSLAGRFELGETITGGSSGAQGTLTAKFTDMNQLIIQNVTGSFYGDPTLINNSTERVTGSVSEDSVATYHAYKYIDAPNYYYLTGDPEKRIQSNAIFINGGIPSSNLSYVTNREKLFEANEARSKIRIVDPKYIDQFAEEYETIINV
jgi:hypothetical protein